MDARVTSPAAPVSSSTRTAMSSMHSRSAKKNVERGSSLNFPLRLPCSHDGAATAGFHNYKKGKDTFARQFVHVAPRRKVEMSLVLGDIPRATGLGKRRLAGKRPTIFSRCSRRED